MTKDKKIEVFNNGSNSLVIKEFILNRLSINELDHLKSLIAKQPVGESRAVYQYNKYEITDEKPKIYGIDNYRIYNHDCTQLLYFKNDRMYTYMVKMYYESVFDINLYSVDHTDQVLHEGIYYPCVYHREQFDEFGIKYEVNTNAIGFKYLELLNDKRFMKTKSANKS